MPTFPPPPHCRDAAPWTWCGDRRDPAFGSVFAWPAAAGAVALTFDRDGRQHAVTLFAPVRLEAEIVIYGRRFSLASAEPAEARR
jgi:hypothetical protein